MGDKHPFDDFAIKFKAERKRLKLRQDAFGNPPLYNGKKNDEKKPPDSYYLRIANQKTVRSWEGGQTLPDIETATELCELFDCDLEYLFGNQVGRRRPAADIMQETELTELAVLNLLNACAARNEEIDAKKYSQRFRDYEIGRFAKTPFISFLLENDELWEKMAVSAYDYVKQTKKYRSSPTHNVEGITHDQFANAAKERAKRALSDLFDELIAKEVDISEWEEA